MIEAARWVPDFVWAALILYATVVVGAYLLSQMGSWLVESCRMAIGERMTLVFVDAPALLLHEMSHLVVAIFFGHEIREVKLTGLWKPGAGAHVITAYNPKSLRQRLGVSMMALAPVALPMAVLVTVVTDSYGAPSIDAPAAWLQRLAFTMPEASRLPFFLLAIYLQVLIAATMRLSTQDWITTARGALSWAVLLILLCALLYGGSSPWAWPPTVLLATSFAMAILSKAAVLGLLLVLALMRRGLTPRG